MKPSVGRIVHFKDRNREGVIIRPAIITTVWPNEMVNINVFNDRDFQSPNAGTGSSFMVAQVKRGEGDGEWDWPKREE